MEVLARLLLLGLGAGAVYAGLGLALVLTHQGARVVNFAHGAMAMYAAYLADELRDTGDYLLPVVGIPARIDLGGPMTMAPALAIAVVTAAVLGAVSHVLVFAPLRRAPLVAKVVASVGVMLVLQGLVFVHFGSNPRTVLPYLAIDPVRVPLVGVDVQQDRLALAAIVVAIGLLLALVGRTTRVGLAVRATGESDKGTVLLGWSPVLVGASASAVASGVAGLVGVLASPISSLNTITFLLAIVPALAAALIGRFTSLGLTVAAGLGLGMFESAMGRLAGWGARPDWLPVSALQKGLPFVVVVVALVAIGSTVAGRDDPLDARQAAAPGPRHPWRTVVGCAAVGTTLVLVTEGTVRLAAFVSISSALLMLSLVVLTGFTGQVSLAQAVFAGAAGFVTAKVAVQGVPFPLDLLAGACTATAVGLLMAIPAVRIRGAQLAVVTMAAGIAVEEFVFKNPSVSGASGAQTVPPWSFAGVDLAANRPGDFNRWPFGLLAVGVLTLVVIAVLGIRRGDTGRRLLAVRANERAAASIGIPVMRTKLIGFGVSAFIAGLGGGLLAQVRGAISVDSFSVFLSLVLLAFAYLGGIGTVHGAFVGALLVPGGLLFGALDQLGDGGAGTYATLIGGLGLIVTSVTNPDGLAGRTRQSRRTPSPTGRPVAAPS